MINLITQGVKDTTTLLNTEVTDGTVGVGVKEVRMGVEKACRLHEPLELSNYVLIGRRTIPWLQPSRPDPI
jgi:hypothetical protein